MRLRSVRLRSFKRFTDAYIEGLGADVKLVVLAGPNGSGKSSFFDGLKTWHWANGGGGQAWDESYGTKVGTESIGWPDHVQVEFHEPLPNGPEDRKKLVYVRSAFRNEADFSIAGFNRMPSPLDAPRVSRMIDTDASVSDNYQRLVMATIDGVYSDDLPETMTKGDIRDRVIGRVREAMAAVFPDLQLVGVGGMKLSGASDIGTFYFSKGKSRNFLYKNLSAGEKAAFDLLLDAVVKAEYYDNSLWCIDEPETHLNTRVQGRLLGALIGLLPTNSQMILATHSLGFMRSAWDMARAAPNEVAFLDLQGINFDEAVVLHPVAPTRLFWAKTLDVALGELASLMAPEHVVLCEGRPPRDADDRRAEFDASCYRTIFASEFPNTDFLSVGNSHDVRDDRLEAGRAIQTIASGTRTTRLIDRDLLSEQEVADAESQGMRLLSRRNIEAYLLDDEVLAELALSKDQQDKTTEIIALKRAALAASVARGNDPDDYKKAAGDFYNNARRLLQLTGSGSSWDAFARDVLAALLVPSLHVYSELRRDIFGDLSAVVKV